MLESVAALLPSTARAAEERAALGVARGICRLFARNAAGCAADIGAQHFSQHRDENAPSRQALLIG